MILGKYIRELLDARKRVILAGFGNLELTSPDEVQSPSGTRIDPPGISVRFDSSYSKDDGVLASAYAEGEGLEHDEAQQRVLELIDAIKFALDRGESYSIPETGSFARDEDGKVRFQVDPAWLLEPDQYGLESMELLELEELAPEEEATEAEKPKPASIPASSPEPAPKITPLAPPKPKAKPMRWRVVWMVVFLLIIVLAVLIILPPRETENGEKAQRFWNRKAAEEVVDQPTSTPEEEEVATGEQDAGEAEETPPDTEDREEPAPVEVSDHYFVIAGSFSNLRNASDLQDQLIQKGFDAEVMITENRMYRVSVASFATKAEGQKGLAEIKKKPGLKSCWLLSN
jgi:cell division septation protein DedD/nucleoid DNA-binding protein